jgi:hypothetical protein
MKKRDHCLVLALLLPVQDADALRRSPGAEAMAQAASPFAVEEP